MVVQEDNDLPEERSVVKTPHTDTKKYVIVKNHVRELAVRVKQDTENSTLTNKSPVKHQTKKKKLKESERSGPTSSCSGSGQKSSENETEIRQSDLEELRTVYFKCKEVMNKIESKYGHLLDLEEFEPNNLEMYDKCTCSRNKKIIFDDDGQQLLTEADSDIHICCKKLKRRHSDTIAQENIEIEFEECNSTLPEDLTSLSIILKDSNIRQTYRNEVINKIRTKRVEFANEIKFSRPGLIEKVKLNPDEVFEFTGSNLFTLSGYPVWE